MSRGMGRIIGDYRWRLGELLVEVDRAYDREYTEWLADLWSDALAHLPADQAAEAAGQSWGEWQRTLYGQAAGLRRTLRLLLAPVAAVGDVVLDRLSRRLP